MLRRWLPVAVWSAVLFVTSGDLFSAGHTGAAFRTIFGVELPFSLHVALRKLTHVLGYGILGALAYRAARIDFRRPLTASFAIVLFVAVVSEWFQSRFPSRTGTVWDVLLDVVGAALAILFLRARMTAA